MNSNRAAIRVTEAAADASSVIIIFRSSHQHAHVVSFRLGIDGKAVSFGDFNTIRGGQLAPVRQNQVDMADDGDAAVDSSIAVDHVPAVAPYSLSCHNRSRFCRAIMLRQDLGDIIPCVVDVRHICLLRQRRDGQQQQQDQ